jgi:CRISPR-associated endoribonuclease Cas6
MNDSSLKSVVVVLRALQPYAVKAHLGRAARQCFFALAHQRDTRLVSLLHDGDHDLRPYTVSDVHRASRRPVIEEGESVWFRVTALDKSLSHLLTILAQDCPGAVIELDKARWQIEALLTEGHPWAATTTWQALAARHMQQKPTREIRFQFVLPVGFRTKGQTMPLPLPSLVFDSLAKRWNTFSGAPLPALLEAFIDQNISIVAYRGETHQMTLKDGHPEIGFTGEVAYHITGRNPSLEKVDPELSRLLADNFTPLAQAVNLLADFAFYSGIGIKTTVGMGMVRRIHASGGRSK